MTLIERICESAGFTKAEAAEERMAVFAVLVAGECAQIANAVQIHLEAAGQENDSKVAAAIRIAIEGEIIQKILSE